VARLGGDEFGILLAHANQAIAQETARRLIDRIAEASFAWDGDTLPLSVAIGVTTIDPDDQPEAVICRADKAMYREKAAAEL
jgi:diguanylate cyclase (GGDEF)-like protein